VDALAPELLRNDPMQDAVERRATARELANSLRLRDLGAQDGPEIRVWVMPALQSRVKGWVVTPAESLSCETILSMDPQGPIENTAARCQTVETTGAWTRISGKLPQIPAYDKRQLSCPATDGRSVYIEQVVEHRLVTVLLINPDLCVGKDAAFFGDLLVAITQDPQWGNLTTGSTARAAR
jgi:hypothetical protein